MAIPIGHSALCIAHFLTGTAKNRKKKTKNKRADKNKCSWQNKLNQTETKAKTKTMQRNCRGVQGSKGEGRKLSCSALGPGLQLFFGLFSRQHPLGHQQQIINMKQGTCIIGRMAPSAMHLCVSSFARSLPVVGNPVQTGISKFWHANASVADLCGQ